MKRHRFAHLFLLVAIGSHVTQAVYYTRLAVAMMENDAKREDEPAPAEVATDAE